MLPAREELMELRRRNRGNFTPQFSQRQMVNTRQDAPVAPFHIPALVPVSALEDLTLGLERAERDFDVADRDAGASGQFGGSGRAKAFHPAAHGGEGVVDDVTAFGRNPETGTQDRCPPG